MKKTAILAALALSATVWSSSAQDQGGARPERPGAPRPEGGQQGQRPEGQRPPGGPGQGGREGGFGQGQGGFRPMPNPIITALDANSDGTIDESELKNATVALKKLDKDGDGKLSQEETRPAGMSGRGGPGGPGGQGGPGGPGGQAGPGGQGGQVGGDFVARMMESDKNGDGKLAKDEVSERMQGMFGRMDANSDGFIDKKEIEASFAQMRERGGQGGGRPPGEGGARPEGNRPQRPPAE